MRIKVLATLAICASLALSPSTSFAHHGGGHHNYDYHNYDYHNYDYDYDYHSNYDCSNCPAHAHVDGVCPYYSDDASYQCYRASTVKKVQNKLNNLGYNCGNADGVYGAKTKNCIKKYQRKKNMTVNGRISQKLLKKLKINY